MVTFQIFRCPRSSFTTSVSTGMAYVGLYEDGRPLGRVWATTRLETGLDIQPARVSVLWPLNKGLPALPIYLEGLPPSHIEYEGYFGGNLVTLADGRRFRLPLRSGGYLDQETGELVAA